MSTEVEKRIVEMKFDNKGFAEGVKDTMNNLDALDKRMEFDGGKKGLKSLQTIVDSVKFDKMLDGIQAINERFQFMTSFVGNVVENIQNKLAGAVTDTLKRLTIDQVTSGFKEYELKMDSVKTIMNSSGASIERVNEILAELNDYSDKTIYSFSDMTSSIGKFTNAGVELDDAVLAIKGISNEAAVAGANAQQASAAMYNFSQALSSGSVKLIDWKSIENANMATKSFKEQLIATAVELGTVTKAEEGYISTTTDANGKVSDAFDAVAHFNDSLSSGWMTKDVLVKTLAKYADETTDFGKAAYAAAGEVTTFSKMMDTLEESVGSGWAETWEILFGNLEEAKKLWTGINDTVSGFIAGIADTRNGILQMWKAADGGSIKDLLSGLNNIYKIIRNIAEYIGLALETLTGHRFLQNFDDVKAFFADRKSFSGNIVVISKISSLLISATRKFKEFTDELYKAFDGENFIESRHFLEEIYQCTQAILVPLRFVARILIGLASNYIPLLAKAAAAAARIVIFLVSRIGYAFTEKHLQHKLYALADVIVNVFGGSVTWLVSHLEGLGKKISEAFGAKDSTDMLKKVSSFITGAFHKAIELGIGIVNKFVGAISKLKDILSQLAEVGGNKIARLTAAFKEFWTSNEKLLKIKEDFKGFFDYFTGNSAKDAEAGVKSVTDRAEKLKSLGWDSQKAWEAASNSLAKVSDLSSFFRWFKGNATLKIADMKQADILGKVSGALKDVFSLITDLPGLKQIKDFLTPVVTAWQNAFANVNLKDNIEGFGKLFVDLFNKLNNLKPKSFLDGVSSVAKILWEFLGSVKDFLAVNFDSLFTKLEKFWDTLFPTNDVAEKSGGNFFTNMIKMVTNGLHGIVVGILSYDWEGVTNLLKMLLSLYLIKKVLGFLTTKKSVSSSIKGIFSGIEDIVTGIGDASKMSKYQIMAEVFTEIAEDILKLVAAVTILANIPEDMLYKGLGALAIIAGLVLAFMFIKNKFIDAQDEADDANSAVESLKDLGGKLVDNLKEFGENLVKGITSALKKAALAALIIAIGVVLTILVGLINTLKGISITDILAGIGKLVLLSAFVLGFVAVSVLIDKFSGFSAGYLKLAVFILAVTKALKSMVKLVQFLSEGLTEDQWETGAKRLKTISGILIVITGLLSLIGTAFPNTGGLTKISAGILVFAIAVGAFVGSVILLSLIPSDRLKTASAALIAIAGAIAILMAATAFLDKIGVGFMGFVKAAVGMLVVAAALTAFTKALILLAENAQLISDNIALIAGVFGVFIGVLLVLGIITAAFEPLGAALLMVGGAALMLGAGFFLAAAAVKLFAEAIVLIAEKMDTIINAVTGKEEQVINAVSTLIYAVTKGLMDAAVYFIAAIVGGLDDAIKVFDDHAWSLGYHLGSACTKFLVGFIAGLFGGLWSVVQSVMEDEETLQEVSDTMMDNAFNKNPPFDGETQEMYKENAKETATETAKAYKDTLNNEMTLSDEDIPWKKQPIGPVSDYKATAQENGTEVGESYKTGLMGSLGDVTGLVDQLPADMQKSLNEAAPLDFSSLLGNMGTEAAEGGEEAKAATATTASDISGIFGDLSEQIGDTGGLSMESLTQNLTENSGLPIDTSGGISEDMLKQFTEADWSGTGENVDADIAKGQKDNAGELSKATDEAVDKALDVDSRKAGEAIETGENLIGGIRQGMYSESGSLYTAAEEITQHALNVMKKTADEHSPSKITEGYGLNIILGWVKGLNENEYMLTNAAKGTTTGMLDSIRNAMADIPRMMDDAVEYSPVISPILDNTNVAYGMRGLNSILSGGANANLTANMSVGKVDVGSAVGELSSITNKGNSDLLDALRTQARQTEHLIDLLENQKIYLDGNTLVGKTISRIDSSLGQRAILAGRRG